MIRPKQISSKLVEFVTLTTDAMSATDKAKVLADMSHIQTILEAKKLALEPNYALHNIDHSGRVKVLLYRGIEILMMYKRMTSSVPLSESHGTPSFRLNNLDDVWMLVNIANIKATTSLKAMFQSIELLKTQLAEKERAAAAQVILADAQTLGIEYLEGRIKTLLEEHTTEVEKLQAKLAKAKATASSLRYNSTAKSTSPKKPVAKSAKATVKKSATRKRSK